MPQYKVQKGDTLWSIAQKLLGNGALWQQLGYSGDPNKLAAGTVLNYSTPTSPTSSVKPASIPLPSATAYAQRNAPTTTTTTTRPSIPIVSGPSYYNHNPAPKTATPRNIIGGGGVTVGGGVSVGGGGQMAGGGASPDFSGVTSAPSIPGFSFDWGAAEKEALEKLTPYYQEKLALAGGDVALAKRRIEEDYQTGKRYREEDLTSQITADDLQRMLETRNARAGLNARGVLVGEMGPDQTGAAPESGYAQQYVMNPLRQQQDARRLAIQRAIQRQEELAGTSKSRGFEDQDIAFNKYRDEIQEEKQQKAITQMAPMAYQQAYDKYLATIGRSIG